MLVSGRIAVHWSQFGRSFAVVGVRAVWPSYEGRVGDVLAPGGCRAWKAAKRLGELSTEH